MDIKEEETALTEEEIKKITITGEEPEDKDKILITFNNDNAGFTVNLNSININPSMVKKFGIIEITKKHTFIITGWDIAGPKGFRKFINKIRRRKSIAISGG